MELGIQVSSLKPLLNTPEQVDQVFAQMAQMGCRPSPRRILLPL